MEATTATTPAAGATTTTTKYYNKTKQNNNNNNNHHQQQQQTQNKSTTSSGKRNQQQTYRDLEDSQEPQKKLTAKQAKQAAKLAAQQQQQQQNNKNDTRQGSQQQHKDVSKTMTTILSEKETKSIPAINNQKTINTTSTTSSSATATANNTNVNVSVSTAKATVMTSQRSSNIDSSSGSSSNYANSISNSSNFNKSDNSFNKLSNNNNNSDHHHQQQQIREHPNSTSDNLNSAAAEDMGASVAAWNNSKYLHKKFKRLASTTENDVLQQQQEAEKLRTTSMSSASSSVSSPPPPAPPAPPSQTSNIQQSALPATQQASASSTSVQQNSDHPGYSLKDEQPMHLKNGYIQKPQQEVGTPLISDNNAMLQNQVLLQIAQHQQQQQTPQQNTHLGTNAANPMEDLNVSSTANNCNTSSIQPASSTAGSGGGGGGRYICPYCNLSCTKPSVLQKHIRAHTNERPYPCDICDIAFKTKSNLYKHCRSRSHAARQKGIEVPPDADDGLSDQDVDPELSNSSSEVLSRTGSPMEEMTAHNHVNTHQQQFNEPQHNTTSTVIPTPLNSASSSSAAGASPLPPASPVASRTPSAYMQHSQQMQQHQLPLGSPAAGTLPPPTNNMTGASSNSGSSISSAAFTNVQKQAIDKPYKPKFHNASLYASPKEAAAAAAAAAAAVASTGITLATTGMSTPSPVTVSSSSVTTIPIREIRTPPQFQQQNQHATTTPPKHPEVPTVNSVPPQNLNHSQQPLLIETQKLSGIQQSSPALHTTLVHLPPQPSPGHMNAPTPPHHPSLSPSTQIKLNNHISSHQLQQLQSQAPPPPHHHLLGPPPPQTNALPLSLAPYYLGPAPPGSPGALLHPSAHPAFYNPMAAAAAVAHQQAFASLHLMTPQQQQQFRHQLQLQQQHLQHLQHSAAVVAAAAASSSSLPASQAATQNQPAPQQTPPTVALAPSTAQPVIAPPSPVQSHIKSSSTMVVVGGAAGGVGGTNLRQSPAHNPNNLHHPKANAPIVPTSNIGHPTAQQSSLHYLANAASMATALNTQAPVSNSKVSMDTDQQQQMTIVSQQRSNTNLLQTSNNTGMGEVTLNKEKLNEHINKIISQNEAIVENKELLLQKKYPKTLNRSRSFTNANSSSSTGSSNNSQTLQTTTGAPPSESATNAKLAQVIVQKQQLQQQQQQQQQYIYQQQMQKQRLIFNEKSMEEAAPPPPTVVMPINGTSKHLVAKHIQLQTQMSLPTQQTPAPPSSPAQISHQFRSNITNSVSVAQHQQQIGAAPTGPTGSIAPPSHMANVPLNLSSKSKPSIVLEERLDLSTKQPQGPLPQQPPPATPRKRHSIEQQQQHYQQQQQQNSQQTLSIPANVNDASNSSNSSSQAHQQQPQPSTSAGKYPPNNSIIKNLLLNARGLAIPMGEGEDAVYICPLCSMEFRTAEDLQLHNSTYCQGNNSSANSPASSPSHKYFRSSSMALNMTDLKILSKNPLSLAKLAWSQLKTKPSNFVLSRLSASQANTSKSSSTTTTSATSTQPSSSSSISTSNTSIGQGAAAHPPSSLSLSAINVVTATPKSQMTINDLPMRFVDAPLPSPGPLLGKTPLVDYTPNDSKNKSEEVIITKMHDDRMYNNVNFNDHSTTNTVNKRLKFDTAEKFPAAGKRLTNITSGGEIQPLNALELSKKEERIKRFTSSGGCMIPISECDDVDKSPKMIRTPLLSGGSFQEVSPKKESKLPLPLMQGSQLTPKFTLGLPTSSGPQHFQFPPINQITAFNPLTLPLTEKVIPYVPGIPGPNSLTPQLPLPIPTITANVQQQQSGGGQQSQHLQVPQQPKARTSSPNRKQDLSPMNVAVAAGASEVAGSTKSVATFGGVQNLPSEFAKAPPSTNMRNVRNWNSNVANSASGKPNVPLTAGPEAVKPNKSFNFLRMADNLSPRKAIDGKTASGDTETRHFNLERVVKDQLIIQQPSTSKALSPSAVSLAPLHVDTSSPSEIMDTSAATGENKPKSKFLRPTSLPLRPGTFTPKRHHGITPTANTLPLISPETPRPSKECVQLYLNGNSYTYLGLKSSTKTFYCTLNCPQPSYVQDMHKLSMYSMWQQCAENNPHPLGLKPKEVMSLYDSRQKVQIYNMAESKKLSYTVVAAQQIVMTPFLDGQDKFYHHQLKQIPLVEAEANSPSKEDNKITQESKDGGKDMSSTSASSSQTLVGGYESNENYTYIRGRGRGKYVCSECGIRCKKPSMLKKHIRTHTDVRPYTCKHCNFSFKTKGNLTKHMQSKTHYKKCIELGLNPGPMPADGEFLEPDMEFDQQSSTSAGGRTSSMGNAESDSEGDSSDNETESSNESDSARSNAPTIASGNAAAAEDNKSHLEHEAARCLLSLSMTPPIHTQSAETAGQMVVTTVMASTINAAILTSSSSSATPTPAIRRVISYTSPKPPFDYHKQEQYYSNPEEAMPKNLNNTTASNFEAAPMDLTKPRCSDSSSSAAAAAMTSQVSIQTSVAMNSLPSNIMATKQPSLSSLPGPVQTQAQIEDVIFGGNRDESGLLKTMISVSSKVARSQPGISEEVRNLNEDMMLYDYRREQTLQYYKIKQTQLSRGSGTSAANDVSSSISSPSYPCAMTTSTNSCITTQACNSNTLATTTVVVSSRESVVSSSEVKLDSPLKLPKIEIIEPVEPPPPPTTPKKQDILPLVNNEIPKSFKSSDESEETDEEPPAKRHVPQSDDKLGHNSNLPSVVLQPGTTDFSGVLSGGSNGSNSSSQQPTRTVIVGEDGFTTNNNEILPVHPRVPPLTNADGRPVCSICSKTFQKQSQLALHMNIHYMERKYKCDPCSVSFRTQGHLQKHERSEAHKNKVIMTSTFGVPTTSNPRPFECTDCKIAFRIHGHLAKHLRSKTHVQKLECLQKLPFGTYAEIERAGISLTEIDTSDCENSLISLRLLAQKLIEKDPTSKLGSYTTPSGVQDNNSNTGLVSQDSASEDGFKAAENAAASAIASLDNDSAANTPRRANSTSEDESIAQALNNNLKRRLPGNFSNGEDSDKDLPDSLHQDKRLRQDHHGSSGPIGGAGGLLNHMNSGSPTAN
ncbi:zinc finger protein schnurri isoform X2 [Haematobia irritans]